MATKEPGRIGWMDLTVPNAEQVRDFYSGVIGWASAAVDMGGYCDYNMSTVPGADAVAGVCHSRGANLDLPPVWLPYFTVADLDESIRQCEQLGGKVRVRTRTATGYGRYCVIEDPAGAFAALFEPVK